MSDATETPFREKVGYQALVLGLFSTLATILLVSGNLLTRDVIAERQREDLQESLQQVMPEKLYDNDLLAAPIQLVGADGKPLTIYRGTAGLHVSALAWEVVGRGYAGDIRLILGLDAKGRILGVRVLSHAETPGLGDKIEIARDDWILAFDGLSLGNPPVERWKVDKDGGQFDSFSGATITPRAVVAAIEGGLHFFNDHRETLLQPPQDKPQLDGGE